MRLRSIGGVLAALAPMAGPAAALPWTDVSGGEPPGLVRDGCGRGWFRDAYGACRPDGYRPIRRPGPSEFEPPYPGPGPGYGPIGGARPRLPPGSGMRP